MTTDTRGLIGDTGCGKSVLARSFIKFEPVDPVELENIGDGDLTHCVLHTSCTPR